MNRHSFRFLLGVFLGSLMLAGGSEAEMGGGEGRPTPFVGQIELPGDEGEPPAGECRFSIDVERVSFLVTTVADKYRLVRMLIDCRGEDALALSATDDRLEMLVDDGEGGDGIAAGVLSLRQADGALWDVFGADMRRTLAYPPEVQAGEAVYVFAYFPVDEARSLPHGFRFTIASLNETVRLMHFATAARS
jgi:hypothetical protein